VVDTRGGGELAVPSVGAGERKHVWVKVAESVVVDVSSCGGEGRPGCGGSLAETVTCRVRAIIEITQKDGRKKWWRRLHGGEEGESTSIVGRGVNGNKREGGEVRDGKSEVELAAVGRGGKVGDGRGKHRGDENGEVVREIGGARPVLGEHVLGVGGGEVVLLKADYGGGVGGEEREEKAEGTRGGDGSDIVSEDVEH
jgi:hypothetical protein